MKDSEINEDGLAPEIRNQLLLYWSGELDAVETEELEARLAEQPLWQAYLDELQQMSVGVQQTVGEAAAPSDAATEAIRRFRALDREERASEPGRVVFLPWLKPLLAAAAAVILVGVVWDPMGLRERGNVGAQATVRGEEKAVEPAFAGSRDTAPVVGRSRSSRLFAARGHGRDARFESTRRQVKRLRTKMNKS